MERPILLVKMAEMAVVENGQIMKTTVGSCVGVVLHDGARHISGMAHIMLPRKLDRDESIGKYADSALPALLGRIVQRGGSRAHLTASIAGGAAMFPVVGDGGMATIGEQNTASVKRLLADWGIRLVFEDTGGEQGRTLLFDNQSGRLEVRTLCRIDPSDRWSKPPRKEER